MNNKPLTKEEKQAMFGIFKTALETDNAEMFFDVMKGIMANYILETF